MSKTPKADKCPTDVVSNAVHVMKITTGEIEESLTEDGRSKAAVELGRKGGLARASSLSKAKRRTNRDARSERPVAVDALVAP
jgi:hypothetical protein